MFANKKENASDDLTKEQNKIAQGTTFKGDIDSQGSFRIEGTVIGSITTAGKVVIGKTGYVEGLVNCEYADVEGKISGEIHVNALLTLKSNAIIEGNVFAEKLAIEPGAVFNATCKMKGAVKSLNDEKRRQQQTRKKEQTA